MKENIRKRRGALLDKFAEFLRPPAWIDPFIRLYTNIQNDYVGLLAAGVAFYFFMSAFPALAALISVYGLFSDPQFVTDQIRLLDRFLPPDTLAILTDQARSITRSNEQVLSIGIFIGIALAVYSATKGVNALIKGLNIACNQSEKRNFLVLSFTAYAMTFGMMVYLLVSLSLVAVLPAVLQIIHLPEDINNLILLLRWPFLMVSALVGLEFLYYFGPSRKRPRWRWVSWGSFTATVLWLAASSLFSLFISNFGQYNEVFGSLSAVAVLLLWFWMSGFFILMGAEINTAFKKSDTDDGDMIVQE